jgi:hypothetical protein
MALKGEKGVLPLKMLFTIWTDGLKVNILKAVFTAII